MGNSTADVVIVGGGVMGTSILYHLAAKGVTNTVLLEQGNIASGSTGKSQAILRMHYSNEVTARMAWESLHIFKRFEEITGTPSGYTKTGYFTAVKEEDRSSLESNVALLKGIGIDTHKVESEEVVDIAPMLAAKEGEVFAYEPQSGYADPYSVANGFAQKARELGATVRTDSRVTAVEVSGGRATAVVADGDRIEAGAVVSAAGPWSKEFLAQIGVEIPLETIRHQVVMLRRPDDIPEHPILNDVVNGISPRPDVGNITLIGVGEEEQAHPDTFNQGVDMDVMAQGMERLSKRIPGMERALFRGGWSGLFTVTPDWHPVLGRVEEIDGLYCATGFSGHGFKLSPMIGLLMAEAIVDGQASTLDISMLGLHRFKSGKLMQSRYGMSVLA